MASELQQLPHRDQRLLLNCAQPIRCFPLGLSNLSLIENHHVECNSPDVTNALHQVRNQIKGEMWILAILVCTDTPLS